VVTDAHELEADGEARLGGIISPLAWVLLAAAVAHIGVDLFLPIGSAAPFPPQPWEVLFAVRAASAFGLAAAVIIGAGNWPHGRPWLMLGAAALALYGALTVLGQGMTYWVLEDPWQTSERVSATQWFSTLSGFVSIAAAAAAPILLAVGLWRGAGAPTRVSGWRWSVVAGAAVVGLLALTAASWLAMEVIRRSPQVGLGATWELISGVEAAAWALLSVAAIRAIGSRAPLPEALVGAGALLAAAGAGGLLWAHLALILVDPTQASALPSQLAALANVLGLLLVGIGFASGRLVPPPEA
jgi:hypothetical protein